MSFCAEALAVLIATKECEVFSLTDIVSLLTNIRTIMKTTSHLNLEVPIALFDENYKHLNGFSREYRIEIIKDMSRCFCLDKTAHRPSTQSNHQYFHFSKFREHQQSETALWRRLFLLVLVFNIYSPKFW